MFYDTFDHNTVDKIMIQMFFNKIFKKSIEIKLGNFSTLGGYYRNI